MRRNLVPIQLLLFVIALFILPINIYAQIKPDGSQQLVLPVQTPPGSYNNTTVNYIRTWEPSMPTFDPTAVISSTDITAVKQTTQYFDGLGRLLQTVIKGISKSGQDMVTPVIYDTFGREQYKYLPYVSPVNDGKFRTNPFVEQQTFAGTQYPGEQVYYGETQFEASPLNRVLKTLAPGNSWEGSGRGVENSYQVNTTADAVVIWNMTAGATIPTQNGVYASGQLFKNVVKDEAGNRVAEFKDKEGKVILKRVEITPGAADGYIGWLCTYYVYDDLSNLRFVISPKAVQALLTSWVISQQVADELCYQYQYDGRNRMIVKKIPGTTAPTEMVYDVRDRLVFTRDGNLLSKNQWMVTFYDALNRPTMSALYNGIATDTRDALQTRMNAATSNTQSIPYIFPGVVDLSVNNYDSRPQYIATQSVTLEMGFDTGAGAATEVLIDPAFTPGATTLAATNPLPGLDPSTLTPLTYTFYDDYSYTGVLAPQTGDFNKPQAGSNPYAEPVTAVSAMTKGLVTGAKVRVVGTNTWLTTSTYYNDKGRVIQLLSENINNGVDVVTSLYDFNGKQLSTYQHHNNPHSKATPDMRLLTNMSYDAVGRLTSISKQVNDDAAKVIVQNSYNELGQLMTKTLGANLESLTYDYNIRGWLKGINKSYAQSGSAGHYFGTELHYDYGYTQSQYNGNIAGITWRSKSDNQWRSYGYNYDAANRLLKGDFTQNNSGWNNTAGVNFSMQMGDGLNYSTAYDANGNILGMTQQGLKGTSSAPIDKLSYVYLANSNKLQGVTDAANDPSSTLGDFKEVNGTGTNDYAYDANGNLTQDANKNIPASGISYNHLNLPTGITITGKGNIQYLYDAAGNKLRKTVTDNTVTPAKTTVTDYIGGVVYQNDTMQFLAHEEGRVRPVLKSGLPISYVYDYFVKDHLGDVRMVLTEQSDFSMYAATMETAPAATETALFSNIDNTRTAKPVGYPQDNTTQKNEFVAKLNAKAGGQKIGPSLVLRVMAGDTIKIDGKAFYKSDGPKNSDNPPHVEDMVADLVRAFNGADNNTGAHGEGSANQSTPFTNNFYSNDYKRLKEKDPEQNKSDKPKAYLNFALFDDQFKLVEENSGVRQVKGEPDQLQSLGTEKMAIKKSGFLYVYTSNESQQDVFFDNVILGVTSGPVLEETHYYPFGLTMAGISSSALKGSNYPENRKKYNGIEYTNELDLDIYDAQLRNLDPQIGRWNQIDPKTENMEMWSPYVSNYDNPIRYNDFLGDEPGPGDGLWNRIVQVAGIAVDNFKRNTTAEVNFVRDLGKQGIDNFKNRIATGTTTPQLILNDFSKNPLAAITGIGSIEVRAAAVVGEEMAAGAKVAEVANGGVQEVVGAGKVPLPDNALVVRGGVNTPESVAKGIGNHPEGVTGVSVECGTCSVEKLAENIPHNQVGVTTVGEVRAAGGDVIKTSGKSPNHATLTNLTPKTISELLNPPIKNPAKKTP
ncbi:YD repeat-containing protein [Chitinophaga niastensis]|uniref:YD repeat-containing protein n=1 Tax=Chitinophaga niastensis TaxID=536980 RepID=A0A2P8HHS6_CHINA|nr:DUF6443 domain-containing protein [Chitinophaga niastensis]PSL45740.1 YD repeat-containing protein [Chitinophaga niastensis]